MNDKILKAAIPDRILGSSAKILKRETYEATREAHDVVEQAQEKANQIIAEAEHERVAMLEQGRQQGVAKGLAEWNSILAATRQRSDELAKSWEETMLRLSIRVAEKIIGEELKLNPEAIVSIVSEVLKSSRPGRRLAIQVSESEAAQVRARVSRLREYSGISSEIEIVASSSVPAGGCVIESELGIIDARLETQLKCLEQVLVGGTENE